MILEGLFVILIGIAVGVTGQLVYLFIIDHEMMRTSKAKMKELQQQLRQTKPDDPKFKELYSELMKENGRVMKQSLKPTFITFVPFLIVFFLMSAYFSYVPIASGSQIQAVLSGPVNGTLSFQNGCVTINGSSSLTIVSTKLPAQFDSTVNSPSCTATLVQNGVQNNVTITGLISSNQAKTYKLGNASLEFSPNTLIVTTLPFSIPFIGSQINWFWAYLFFSLVSGITLNRILLHYKLIA